MMDRVKVKARISQVGGYDGQEARISKFRKSK
jgi:hypothetical protein